VGRAQGVGFLVRGSCRRNLLPPEKFHSVCRYLSCFVLCSAFLSFSRRARMVNSGIVFWGPRNGRMALPAIGEFGLVEW